MSAQHAKQEKKQQSPNRIVRYLLLGSLMMLLSPIAAIYAVQPAQNNGGGGCPAYNGVLSASMPSPDISVSTSVSANTIYYSLTTPDKSPTGGVPGIIEYCV